MNLAKILTETRNSTTLDIDNVPTLEIVRLINQADSEVAGAVAKRLPQIAEAADCITKSLKKMPACFT